MFQSYKTIINDASQSELNLIEKYDHQKEKNALEIKNVLDIESKKIIEGQTLKTYNPIEINNKITSLHHQHQNIINEQTKALEDLQINTENKLFDEMKHKPNLPITSIYKDIYSHNNGNCWVCRVWFSLVENTSLNLKPGDPIKVSWFDINANRNLFEKNMKYQASSERKTNDANELKIPCFQNQFGLNNENNLYPIDKWGINSNQKTWWLEWVKNNRPI